MDREIVLAAVIQNGGVLEYMYASDNLSRRTRRSIVLVAVTQDGHALQYDERWNLRMERGHGR